MRFSVILPTYNAAATLRRALNSVLNQKTHIPFEVVVVDDISSDDSALIAQEYTQKSPNVVALKTDKNGGPGAARNKGVEHAKGEWILFLDADDEFEPGFFENLDKHITESATSEDDMVAFDWHNVDAKTFKEGADTSGLPGARNDLARLQATKAEYLNDYLLNKIDCSVIFHAFRRDFLNKNDIHFRGGLHEDVDYMFHSLMRARNISVLNQPIYKKWNTTGSIINTLSRRHIDGYFNALEAMYDFFVNSSDAESHKDAFAVGLINVASSRLMRLLQDKIVKQEEAGLILATLSKRVNELVARMGTTTEKILVPGSFQTKYKTLFKTFTRSMAKGVETAVVMQELRDISEKSWSCYDLHNSVFLAPGEIRTCCKRFFHNGKLKGDVVLMKGTGEEFKFSYDEIKHKKQELFQEINRDASEECRGCPFLSFEKWGQPLETGIKYISLEHHSVCNMRCTYCSDTYFGGIKPMYDVMNFLETADKGGALTQCEYVVWGGGEPTVERNFSKILVAMSKFVPHVQQRVITNGTMYSEELASLLKQDRAFIVTSIDAGSKAVFQAVRKYDDFERVLNNLQRYRNISPQNVIIKYILLEENRSSEELQGFIALMEKYDLLKCNVQISCNFKTDSIDNRDITSIVELATLLKKHGAHFVFTDDLVWQRIPRMSELLRDELKEHVPEANIEPLPDTPVVVWGTGAQAKIILQKSAYFQKAKIAYFVDPRSGHIGKKLNGHDVRAPSALLDDKYPIVIAAVQSAPFIYKQIQQMGIDKDRIVNGLVF